MTRIKADLSTALIERARKLYASHDELEIDDNANISPSSEGAWVSAWVWVPSETCTTRPPARKGKMP